MIPFQKWWLYKLQTSSTYSSQIYEQKALKSNVLLIKYHTKFEPYNFHFHNLRFVLKYVVTMFNRYCFLTVYIKEIKIRWNENGFVGKVGSSLTLTSFGSKSSLLCCVILSLRADLETESCKNRAAALDYQLHPWQCSCSRQSDSS